MKRIVISHWDLDGLAGATILNMSMKISKTYLSSITAIPKYINMAIQNIGVKGEIWISDLNPQPNQVNELRSLLKEAVNRKIKIYWFDHHEWDKSIYDMLIEFKDNIWYRVDPNTIASDLVARYFVLTDDKYVSKLLELAFDDDYFLNRYELTIMWRRILRWYGWPIRYKALDSFIKKNLKPIWMIELYKREVKNIYENMIREAISRSDTIITRQGLKIVIFQDVDPRIHPGEVTFIAKTNGLIADIYVIRYPRGISLRSDYIDVSLIARKLGGGGHRNAAGIPGFRDIDSLLSFIVSLEEKRKLRESIYLQ